MSQMIDASPPVTTGMVHVPTRVLSGTEARAYAEDLSKSTIMSPYFQGNPANVMYAMELGRTYGMEPVAIISNIHVFDDGQGKTKAALSADFMVCLARLAGHYVHVKATKSKATATLIRQELLEMDPVKIKQLADLGVPLKDYLIFEETWDEDKAATAGLLSKKNWQKYLPDMLKARVKAAIVRAGASEVLIQMSNASGHAGNLTVGDSHVLVDTRHTLDELGGEFTDDGEHVTEFTRQAPPQQRKTAWPQGSVARPAPSAPSAPAEAPEPAHKADAVSPSLIPATVLAYAENATSGDILAWAEQLVNDTELKGDDKLARIRLTYSALRKVKRVDEVCDDGAPLGMSLLNFTRPYIQV